LSYIQFECVKNKMTILLGLELLINKFTAKATRRYCRPIVKY